MAVIEVTPDNFEQILQQNDYVAVDFYGPRCGPCKMLEPIYHEAAGDLAMIQFTKANTDNNRELLERFEVMAVPAVLFFRKGEVVHRFTGFVDRKTLYGHIATMLY